MALRRFVVFLLVATLVLPLAAGAAVRSGLQGTVHRAPSGICPEGDPCDGIARGMLIGFTRLGRTKTVRTDDRGHFKVWLAPGRYSVTAPGVDTPPSPRYVSVRKGRVATVTISFAAPRIP